MQKFLSIFFIIFNLLFCYNVLAIDNFKIEKPENNNLYIYGIGNGNSIDEAINHALEDIKSNIINKNNIVLPTYNIEYNWKDNYKTNVIISIKRNEFFELEYKKLLILNDKIIKIYYDIKDTNDFQKISKINESKILINDCKNVIKTIKTIVDFNEKKYLKDYESIQNEYQNIVNSLSFNILIIDNDISEFKDIISQYFIEKGIKINNKSKNILEISSKIKKNNIYGKTILNKIFIFKLLCDNKVIQYNSFSISEKSNNNFEIVNKNVNEQFKNYFINKNIKIFENLWVYNE